MNETILFVGDKAEFEEMVQKLFHREWKKGELHFFYSSDRAGAIEKITNSGTIDLVFTEKLSDSSDGISLISDIQNKKSNLNPSLTTIFVSENGNMADIRQAMNRGAFDFLNKPLDPHDFQVTLAKAVRHIRKIKASLNQEKKALDAMREAEAANKAKSEFLANMSHEIRTPMNAILGFCELLTEQLENPRHRSYLECIYSSGQSLLSIIDEILDLTKIEAGKMLLQPEAVDIRQILREMEGIFFRKVAQKEIDFLIQTDEEVPRVLYLDEIRIKQVMFNLVSNAIKFTSEGFISISVSSEKVDRFEQTAILRIEVKDSGIGIDEKEHEAIFESFRQQNGQKSREYGGTGLGLTITQKLVEMMKGKIELRSRPGMGSTFTVILPDIRIMSGSMERSVFEGPSNESRQEFSGATVLLVDDVESNRKLVKAYLKDTSLMLIEAEYGEEALAVLKKRKPDLILMDLKLPGKNGFEVTEIIKRDPNLKRVPIIALTAFAMKDSAERIDSIFDGYLKKPITRVSLLSELKKFLLPKTQEPKPGRTTAMPSSPVSFVDDSIKPRLPQIISQIESDLLPTWEDIKDIFYIDDVADFASRLNRLAEKHDVRALIDFSQSLYENTQSNNVDEIERMIALFPSVLSRLRELAEQVQ